MTGWMAVPCSSPATKLSGACFHFSFWRPLFLLFRYSLLRCRIFQACSLHGGFLHPRFLRGSARRRLVPKRLRWSDVFRNRLRNSPVGICDQCLRFCQQILQLDVVGKLPENRLRDVDGVGCPDTLLYDGKRLLQAAFRFFEALFFFALSPIVRHLPAL